MNAPDSSTDSNLAENLFVRSNQQDYEDLLKSIEQLNSGKGQVKELLDE